MQITSQKHRFTLPDGVHFFNAATFSPMSRNVEAAAHAAIEKFTNPVGIKASDFFDYADEVRRDFAKLINADDPNSIAIVPSTSYGMSTVAANLHRKADLKAGDQILILDQEFPNDFYCFERVASQLSLEIKVLLRPEGIKIGKKWNAEILEAITDKVALIVIPQVHWIFGTIFDLKKIADKCQETSTLLVVDGTQSVGAMPFDVSEIKVDALISACYKSLLGAYQTGFAYYGSFFDNGVPLEESWMNRLDSHLFSKLTNLQPEYKPKAQRYNVGEYSNFTGLPISGAALKEILEWTPTGIQAYCKSLSKPFEAAFEAIGCEFEEEEFRAGHLFGITLPEHVTDLLKVQKTLAEAKIMVAVRGKNIRVSPNVYNEPSDFEALLKALQSILSEDS